MKLRHRRNNSLKQQKVKPILGNYHHHSQENSKHQLKNCIINSNTGGHSYLISNVVTLPVSTQIHRESKQYKKSFLKPTQLIIKDKKKNKSKDKDKWKGRDSLYKSKSKFISKDQRQKKSNEKQILKKQSKKKKKSTDKSKSDRSGQRKSKRPSSTGKFSNDRYSKFDKILQNDKSRCNSKKKAKIVNQSNGVLWEQIIEQYGDNMTQIQKQQIKQYKWVYYLGSIKDRNCKRLFQQSQKKVPLSARQWQHNERQDKHHFISLLSQRKVLKTQQFEPINKPQNTTADDQFYKYTIGDHIAYRYEIIEPINRGSFGDVIKVYDHRFREYLAMKIIKKCQQLVQQTFVQISILTHIKEQDKSNLSGIVKIKDFTIFRNHICIIFELLEGNLYDLITANNYNGLSDQAIRIFAVQILNSLSFLREEKIIHCDIKPENIVMKKWGKSGIKLIDFGTSCFQGKQIYEYLQSRYYRSPEIILRKPYSFPIDMWSVGCLLAQLKIGEPIFAAFSDLEHLLYISNLIGLPIQSDGNFSQQFLKTQQIKEIIAQNYLGQFSNIQYNYQLISQHQFFSKCRYIKSCMRTIQQKMDKCPSKNPDDKGFIDFIGKILMWEPSKRLKPYEALSHPWIVKGLPNEIKQLYVIFKSAQFKKQTRSKSKQIKTVSKNKSKSKKSKQKVKSKQLSAERKRECFRWNQSKPKETSTQYKPHRNYHKNKVIDLPFK